MSNEPSFDWLMVSNAVLTVASVRFLTNPFEGLCGSSARFVATANEPNATFARFFYSQCFVYANSHLLGKSAAVALKDEIL